MYRFRKKWLREKDESLREMYEEKNAYPKIRAKRFLRFQESTHPILVFKIDLSSKYVICKKADRLTRQRMDQPDPLSSLGTMREQPLASISP